MLEEKRGADYDKTRDAYRYLVQLYEKSEPEKDVARWRTKLKQA